MNALRTLTPIVDVPQSLFIISDVQIENQAFGSLADILRYTPGLAVSQGEGHRDAIIIRGNQTTAAFRLNAYAEEFASHRDVFDGSRYAVNPTLAVDLSEQTTAEFFYEYVNDDRVVDRGVPSVSVANGSDVPLTGFRDTFFGDRSNSTQLEAHILAARVDHDFSDNLRGYMIAHYADYDKGYQNIYAAGFDAAAAPQRLTLDGYRDATERQNFIIQGNLVGEFETGPFTHTVLVGVEYGDQSTANGRLDNRFAASNDDQITIDFTDPAQVPAFSFGPALTDRESASNGTLPAI